MLLEHCCSCVLRYALNQLLRGAFNDVLDGPTSIGAVSWTTISKVASATDC